MRSLRGLLAAAALAATLAAAAAQSSGPVVGGSPDVTIGGAPAARQGETVDTSTSHLGFRCVNRTAPAPAPAPGTP